MSITVTSLAIELAGHCAVDQAEALVIALHDNPGLPVDARQLVGAHLAIVQVLIVAGRPIQAGAADNFLHGLGLSTLTWINPAETDSG